MRISFEFDDSIPVEQRFIALTVSRFAWSRVRTLALHHNVVASESRGWFWRRFVMHGAARALNSFAQGVWDDDQLGPSFREKCEELGLCK